MPASGRRACARSRFWVPDVRAPAFRAEAHRQSLAVAASAEAGVDQAFIDAVSAVDFGDG